MIRPFIPRAHESTERLRYKHNLPDVLSRFHVRVCVSCLCEGECFVDVRFNPAIFDAAYNCFHPLLNLLRFMPHMTEVEAKRSPVFVNQGDWVKSWHLQRGFHHF